MNRAVFFDRDNTLMENVPYLGDPDKVHIFPGAKEIIKSLYQAEFKIIIITNQAGVGRGYITKEQVKSVNDKLMNTIGKKYFSGIYCCYDHPDSPLENCRKPHPAMILKAQKEHDIDLGMSYFVGDRLADVGAGKNAGCKGIFFLTDYHPEEDEEAKNLADFVGENLKEIGNWILSDSQKV